MKRLEPESAPEPEQRRLFGCSSSDQLTLDSLFELTRYQCQCWPTRCIGHALIHWQLSRAKIPARASSSCSSSSSHWRQIQFTAQQLALLWQAGNFQLIPALPLPRLETSNIKLGLFSLLLDQNSFAFRSGSPTRRKLGLTEQQEVN